MLRKHFITKNIHTDDVKYVIGHNWSIYIKKTFVVLFFLLILFLGFIIASKYTESQYLSIIFWFFWLVLLTKYTVDFLNLYLDGLALSPGWITLFLREGLLEYKTEYFDRDKIVTIHHNQKTLRDKIFAKWDIIINLEQGIEFPFEDISYPRRQVDKIMRLKEMFTNNHIQDIKQKEDIARKDENMQLFMEAFSETMEDFLWKRSNEDNLF